MLRETKNQKAYVFRNSSCETWEGTKGINIKKY